MAAKPSSESQDVPSLETTAEKKIVKSLGDLAKNTHSTFSCGGELTSPDKVQVVYRNKSSELQEVVFPGASDADIQQLLETCSVASFGLGEQQVTNQSYRDAFKLDPSLFATSFQVSNTPILFEAAMTIVPDLHHIRAELYKLNIYTTGGFFKAHVDTPRSDQMIGSLVVCLPTQFSGGALVTRHEGRTATFDWSSTPDSPRKTVSWAAFYSDIEHEVFPVAHGHRITLTYNLYGMQQADHVPANDVNVSPLYSELRAALGSPVFLRGGGVLGFPSHHKYVFTDLNSTSHLPVLLKGADRTVYLAAKSLGLSVIVKPIIWDKGGCMSCNWNLLSSFESFRHQRCEDEIGESQIIVNLFRHKPHHVEYITWCHKSCQWEPAGATMAFGNEATTLVYYQAAAILVGIPKWEEYRRSRVSGDAPLKSGSETPDRERQPVSTAGEKRGCQDREDDESASVLKKLCFHGEDYYKGP